jgi:hypothetical protein
LQMGSHVAKIIEAEVSSPENSATRPAFRYHDKDRWQRSAKRWQSLK